MVSRMLEIIVQIKTAMKTIMIPDENVEHGLDGYEIN